MGGHLARMVSELGGYLGSVEFKLLVRMAARCFDDDKPPVCWQSRAELAAGVRRHGRDLDVATKEALKRAIRNLRSYGLIVPGAGGRPGHVQVFALTLRPDETAELRRDRPALAYGKEPSDWRVVRREDGQWLWDDVAPRLIHLVLEREARNTQRSPVGNAECSPLGNVLYPQWGTSNVPLRNKGKTTEEDIDDDGVAWPGTSPEPVDNSDVSDVVVPVDVAGDDFNEASKFLQRRPDTTQQLMDAARARRPDLSLQALVVQAALIGGWRPTLDQEEA